MKQITIHWRIDGKDYYFMEQVEKPDWSVDEEAFEYTSEKTRFIVAREYFVNCREDQFVGQK